MFVVINMIYTNACRCTKLDVGVDPIFGIGLGLGVVSGHEED
jgi:hypothetical protein